MNRSHPSPETRTAPGMQDTERSRGRRPGSLLHSRAGIDPRFVAAVPLIVILALAALSSTTVHAAANGDLSIEPRMDRTLDERRPESPVRDRVEVGFRVVDRPAFESRRTDIPLSVGLRPAHTGVPALGAPALPVCAWIFGVERPACAPTALSLSAPAGLNSSTARDSLPDGMPVRARLLWGERGLMRGLGLAPDTRAGELRLRRSMLQWHQRFGLVTLGALTTQVVLGELIAKDRVKHADLKPYHKNGAYVTFGLYMTTASLSLFAPPARRYSEGFSSIKLHRRLAVLHFAGMLAQPLLGRSLVRADSPRQYDDRLQTHLWVGRLTLGAYTAAILSTFLAY